MERGGRPSASRLAGVGIVIAMAGEFIGKCIARQADPPTDRSTQSTRRGKKASLGLMYQRFRAGDFRVLRLPFFTCFVRGAEPAPGTGKHYLRYLIWRSRTGRMHHATRSFRRTPGPLVGRCDFECG